MVEAPFLSGSTEPCISVGDRRGRGLGQEYERYKVQSQGTMGVMNHGSQIGPWAGLPQNLCGSQIGPWAGLPQDLPRTLYQTCTYKRFLALPALEAPSA